MASSPRFPQLPVGARLVSVSGASVCRPGLRYAEIIDTIVGAALPLTLLFDASAAAAASPSKAAKAGRHGVTKRDGFRASVMHNDGCLYSGFLEKQSKLGAWQRRYFEVSGHYLKYFADDRSGAKLLASVDLLKASLQRPPSPPRLERTSLVSNCKVKRSEQE